MKKFTITMLLITLLTLTVSLALAQGTVGADCTEPPNLEPFADLVNCDLSGLDLQGINIWSSDLSGANLSDSNLSDALLEGIDFTNGNAGGANFDDANLFASILEDANFDNASFRNTYMEAAEADGASFLNADMRGVDLYFADVRDADLSGANFTGTWMNNIDFNSSTLQNAVFTGADMRSVDFRNADLRGADFSSTNLLSNHMDNADLRDATLLGAEAGNTSQFDGVIWGNTTCADGSNSDDDDGDGFTCVGNFPENVPPTVTLLTPAGGQTFAFGETITISAEAADSDGTVVRLEFYGDGELLAYILPPDTFDWTDVPAGTHVVSVTAVDDDGAEASASATIEVQPPANNQPPTVEITSPRDGQKVYRWWGTDFEADAQDSDGVIIKVEFYEDDTLLHTDEHAPYGFWYRPDSRGTKTLTAKAYDDGAAVTTSAAVTIRAR